MIEPIERNKVKNKQKYLDKSGIRRGIPARPKKMHRKKKLN